jgi:hypothetical protein
MMRWCGSFRVMDLRPRKMNGSVEQVSRKTRREGVRGRTVAHNDGHVFVDGFLGDAEGQVVGEQHPLRDTARGRVDVVLEQADIVPGAVGEFLGVADVC